MAVGVVENAGVRNDAALLGMVRKVHAPRQGASPSDAQPLTASKQSMTARSAKILSSNQYFRRALVNMRDADAVVQILESIRLLESRRVLDSVRGEEPSVAKSLENLLNAAASSGTHFDDRVEKSTAWLARDEAVDFKNYLFQTMLTFTDQPEMRLIPLSTLSKDSPELSERLKVFLDKTGLSTGLSRDGQTQTIDIPRLAKTDSGRNILFLELQPLPDNGSEKSKPIRLFFASGTRAMPESLFHKTKNDDKPSEFKLLKSESTVKPESQDDKEWIAENQNWIAEQVQKAQSEEAVLAIDYSVLGVLGIGKPDGHKELPSVSDPPKSKGSTVNSRAVDTEHMALSFLLSMAEALRLRLDPTGGGIQPVVRYRLDLFSRRPICPSCHLSIVTAVTHENFPRLTEFNIAYGPKPPVN